MRTSLRNRNAKLDLTRLKNSLILLLLKLFFCKPCPNKRCGWNRCSQRWVSGSEIVWKRLCFLHHKVYFRNDCRMYEFFSRFPSPSLLPDVHSVCAKAYQWLGGCVMGTRRRQLTGLYKKSLYCCILELNVQLYLLIGQLGRSVCSKMINFWLILREQSELLLLYLALMIW